MKIFNLLLLLLPLQANCLTVTTPSFDDGGNMLLGWSNAVPGYPLKLWAIADLMQTNWVLVDWINSPSVNSDGNYNEFSEQYLTIVSQPQFVLPGDPPPPPVIYPGLYDNFTVTNYQVQITGYFQPEDIYFNPSGPPQWTDGFTNAIVQHDCFFKLSQDIPPTPPFALADLSYLLTSIVTDAANVTAFDDGFGLGSGIVATCFCFTFIRSLFNQTSDL